MRWSRLKKSINVDDIASSVLDGKKRSKTRANTGHGKPQPTEPKPEIPPKTEVLLKTEGALSIPQLLSSTAQLPGLRSGLPDHLKETTKNQADSIAVPDPTRPAGNFQATQVPHLPKLPEPAPSPLIALPPPSQTPKPLGSPGLAWNTDPEREPSLPRPTWGDASRDVTIVKPTPGTPKIKSETPANVVGPGKRQGSPVRSTRSTSGMSAMSGTAVGTSGRRKRVKRVVDDDDDDE
jgi:hypothetical protein